MALISLKIYFRLLIIVINATFINVLVISWRSVLLLEQPGVQGENHRPTANHLQAFSHNVASRTPLVRGIRTHNNSIHGH